MNYQQLKILLANSISVSANQPDQYTIDFSTGWDGAVVRMANDYFPDNKFNFRLQNQTLQAILELINNSTDVISFSANGIDYPFNDFDLKIVIGIELGFTKLKITSTQTDNPNLADHFPLFEDSLAGNLTFSSILMELDSRRSSSNNESALFMQASLNLDKVMNGLNTMLGLSSNILPLQGYSWFKQGGKLFYGIRLFSDINVVEKRIDPFSVSIADFGIMDEIVNSSIDDSYSLPFLTMSAAINCRGNDNKTYSIPLTVSIYNLNTDIQFKANLSEVTEILPRVETSLREALGLKIDELKHKVPDFDIGKTFTFNELGFDYNPSLTQNNITRIYGGVSLNTSFEIALNFPVEGQKLSASITGLQFNRTNYSGDITYEIDVLGKLDIGNGEIQIELSLASNQSGKDFRFYGHLAEGKKILLSKILECITNNAIDLPDFSIETLELDWKKIGSEHSWSFDIGLEADLPMPFHNPVFTLEQVMLGISKGSGDPQFFIEAVFIIGAVEIDVSAKYDKGWKFEGSTGANQEIPLGELIEMLWDDLMPGTEHKLPASISSLVAENIHVTLDTTSPGGFSFKACFDISESRMYNENFEFADRGAKSSPLLECNDPKIKLEKIKISLERNSSIKFLADARFGLTTKRDPENPVHFHVEAEYNDGWDFEASMEGTIKLSDIIDIFAHDTPVPLSLSAFEFTDLRIAFNSRTSDKHFSGKGNFIVEGTKKISLSLNFDVVNSQTEFSGHLEIIPDINNLKEKYIFDAIFEKNSGNELFLGAYHQENINDEVDIGKIIEGFGVKAPSMRIGLKDAFFVHNKKDQGNINDEVDKKKSTRFNLLVADVGTAMNLSALPLVGKVFPANASLSLALRVLYASNSYSWGVAGVNEILPTGIAKITEPVKDSEGFALVCEMRIGDKIIHLDLPVQLNTTNQIVPKKEKTSPGNAVPVSDDGITWFTIGKQFGPVSFNRIGLTYKNSKIYAYLDAGLNAGGLTFTLNGLSVSSAISPIKPEFSLNGLGLDFKKGPLEIGGSFLKRQVIIGDKPLEEYDGLAILRMESFSISALGSYAYYDGHPSLFIFGYLDAVLGGPAFFFVEGLAAAFGYNRSLVMPTIDAVSKFPLVRQVMEGNDSGANADRSALLTQQLDLLSQYIPPAPGQMFLAAGVRFSSFKLIDSFVLLAVSFGNRLEIDLIGQSNIIVPSEIPPGVSPLAEIKIQLLAKFLPDEGFLAVMAQLTPDSYVFSRNCHLTGGAAFYSWFKGDHKGDFIVTMGGYHSSFNVPSHYPSVPRLGFNWQISNSMNVKGDMYFALCPHAFMAGGHLEALYNNDPLQAWFKAGVDFLIGWQPYHYDARLYLDIGASYTYYFFGTNHITVDVGADVHIWGPEFAGKATVHIWIFDVDIPFGSQTSSSAQPISWSEFKSKCLPEPSKTISSSIVKGKHNEENKIPVVNPKELKIAVTSGVPFISLSIPSILSSEIPTINNSFGVAPMSIDSVLKSELSVEMLKDGSSIPAASAKFKIELVKQKMPVAVWGKEFTPSLNAKERTIELVTGITISAKEPLRPQNSSMYDLAGKKTEVQYDIGGSSPSAKNIVPSVNMPNQTILDDLGLKTLKAVSLQ